MSYYINHVEIIYILLKLMLCFAIYAIPFFVVFYKNDFKKLKSIFSTIKKTIYANKILFIIAVLYSIVDGCISQQFWLNLPFLNQNMIFFTFLNSIIDKCFFREFLMNFSFFNKNTIFFNILFFSIFKCVSVYLEKLLYLPFGNASIMEMKQVFLKNSENYNNGQLQTALSKSENFTFLTNALFQYITKISSFIIAINFIYSDISNKNYFIFIFTSFFIFLLINQFIILHYRRAAWNSTENNRESSCNKILSNMYLKQGLFILNEPLKATIHEKNRWQLFFASYYILRIIFAIFVIIAILPMCNTISMASYFNIKALLAIQNSIPTIIGYLDDFLKILVVSEPKTEQWFQNLKMQNVKIINKEITCFDSINFEMNTDIVILKGKNGIGKSILGKTIAKLISHNGLIERPRTLYINVDLFSSEIDTSKQSKGELIEYFIDTAINNYDEQQTPYQLLILDEVLDILNKSSKSESLYYKILAKLLEKNIKLIIITHNELDLMLAIEMKKTIENITIIDKKIVKVQN